MNAKKFSFITERKAPFSISPIVRLGFKFPADSPSPIVRLGFKFPADSPSQLKLTEIFLESSKDRLWL